MGLAHTGANRCAMRLSAQSSLQRSIKKVKKELAQQLAQTGGNLDPMRVSLRSDWHTAGLEQRDRREKNASASRG
jgi:hypothetical protein